MSSSDVVRIRCPFCGDYHEEPSKTGPQTGNTYPMAEASDATMAGIVGTLVCMHCKLKFQVVQVARPQFEAVAVAIDQGQAG